MIRSKHLRNSARDQECTLQIAGICNCNPETTILAHLPDESHGMALKADDISACFACSACHDVIDSRSSNQISNEDREFYMRRAQIRTWNVWIGLGLVTVKGAK